MFTDIDRNYVTYNSYEALNYILALEEVRLRQKAFSLPQSQLKVFGHIHSMSNFGLFFFFRPNELNFCMWSPI